MRWISSTDPDHPDRFIPCFSTLREFMVFETLTATSLHPFLTSSSIVLDLQKFRFLTAWNSLPLSVSSLLVSSYISARSVTCHRCHWRASFSSLACYCLISRLILSRPITSELSPVFITARQALWQDKNLALGAFVGMRKVVTIQRSNGYLVYA